MEVSFADRRRRFRTPLGQESILELAGFDDDAMSVLGATALFVPQIAPLTLGGVLGHVVVA